MTRFDQFTIQLTTDPSHYEACARIMVATDPWITLGMDYGMCIKAFDGEMKEIYVMQVDEQIAGFVILQIGGSFKGYIQTLCIEEAFRGKGLGTKLLQFCQERILQISPNLFICVSSFNAGALRLYTNFGFQPVGPLNDFVREGYTELLMRKSFGPIVGYHPAKQ